ncbi:MAG: lipopolysaccharide heptosyltransferase II [Verrucomicrobiota bacterium]
MNTDRLSRAGPERILVRGVNWLGDAVMTTPALLRLREAFPHAHIALLTQDKLADLWQDHPAVNEVLTFGAKEFPWSVGQHLKAHRFELGIILPNSPRSAIELWLAEIPRRVGYSRPWRNAFLTEAVTDRPGHLTMRKRTPQEIQGLLASDASSSQPPVLSLNTHHIHQYLHLVGAVGASTALCAPLIAVREEEVINFQYRMGTKAGEAVLGMVPGAEYGPAKRWPAERFVEVVRRMNQTRPCRWVIFGGGGDAEIAAQIASQLTASGVHCANLAGATSLRELCAGLKTCCAVLTNDTGPMHVAAAVGTPVVALFGSTSPELTAPGLPGDTRHRLLQGRVVCSPCFLRECPVDFRCMTSITVETVINALRELVF